MANNKSTENLLSDSEDSCEQIPPPLRQVRPVKPRHSALASRKRTAFSVTADNATGETEVSSSADSTPQEYLQRTFRPKKSVVIDTAADIHHYTVPSQTPPVPMPRKLVTQPVNVAGRFNNGNDILEFSSDSSPEDTGNRPARKLSNQNLMPTISDSSGERSAVESQQMFFARSRKNTIVDTEDIPDVTLVQGFRASTTSAESSSRKADVVSSSIPIVQAKDTSSVPLHSSNNAPIRTASPVAPIQPMIDNSNSDGSDGSNDNTDYTEESEALDKIEMINEKPLNKQKLSKNTTRDGSIEMKNLRSRSAHKIITKSKRKPEQSTDFGYTYEKLIGIYIHETSKLQFDYLIRKPMVRCTIIDISTGEFLAKSDPNREAVHHYEPSNVDFIQPLISKGCSFKKSESIECLWDELLLINEDINHIVSGNEIMFFEIIDMVQLGQGDFLSIASADGWHHICWAFLRPGNGQIFSNVDKRCRLQLYSYQKGGSWRSPQKIGVFEQWKLKRMKYPGTLDVTVKGLKPIASYKEPASRPMNVLQEDRLIDLSCSIQTPAVSVDEKMDHQHTVTSNLSAETTNHWKDLCSQWKRHPGQYCKVPNTMVGTCQTTASKGSLTSQFSPDGKFVAFAVAPTEGTANHNIVILTVPSLKTVRTLKGHTNLVYSLNWIEACVSDTILVSASSDRTAIIWMLNHNPSKMYILPHPCFLYTAKILDLSAKELFVVTGGRDKIIRTWRITLDVERTDLVQELEGHKNYITAIVCAKKTKNLYSSDWNGYIIEWTRTGTKDLYQELRTVTSTGINILNMQLHPRGEALYVSSGGSIVNAFDVRTGIPLQSFGSSDFSSAQLRFIISPCGSLLLTSTCTEIIGWNILSGSRLTTYELSLQHSHRKRFITSFDYHPSSNFVCVTVYGQTGDAGLFLLGYKSDNATSIAMAVDQVRRQPQLSEAVLVPERKAKKNGDNEDLAKIIRRIDDIFLLPQNRTDDVKREQPSVTGGEMAKPSRIPIPMPRGSVEMVEILSDGSSSSRSGTFTIPGGYDDAESVGSQTFSVHKLNENGGDDGTYNIKFDVEKGDSGDDTTISESL